MKRTPVPGTGARHRAVSSRASAASRGICTSSLILQRQERGFSRMHRTKPDLLRVGGEIAPPRHQRCEVVDGDDERACASNSTLRKADPASSGASGGFRGPAVEEAKRKIRPFPRHRSQRSTFRRSDVPELTTLRSTDARHRPECRGHHCGERGRRPTDQRRELPRVVEQLPLCCSQVPARDRLRQPLG